MTFDIEYSKQAINFLKRINKILLKRIIDKIEKLQNNPISHDSKAIENYKEKLFRVRVGDYRILYEVDYKNKKIGIIKIDKRSKVYN